MLIGLFIGFFLCFYGYLAKQLVVRLRAVIAGSLVFLTISLLLFRRDALIDILTSDQPIIGLGQLILDPQFYLATLANVLAFCLGALLLFYLARRKTAFSNFLIALFIPLSMGLLIFLLVLGIIGFIPALFVAISLTVVVLAFSIVRFEMYVACESAIAGSLLVAYLFSRFWNLPIILFFAIWAVFTFLGILNQMLRLKKAGPEDADQ